MCARRRLSMGHRQISSVFVPYIPISLSLFLLPATFSPFFSRTHPSLSLSPILFPHFPRRYRSILTRRFSFFVSRISPLLSRRVLYWNMLDRYRSHISMNLKNGIDMHAKNEGDILGGVTWHSYLKKKSNSNVNCALNANFYIVLICQ